MHDPKPNHNPLGHHGVFAAWGLAWQPMPTRCLGADFDVSDPPQARTEAFGQLGASESNAHDSGTTACVGLSSGACPASQHSTLTRSRHFVVVRAWIDAVRGVTHHPSILDHPCPAVAAGTKHRQIAPKIVTSVSFLIILST